MRNSPPAIRILLNEAEIEAERMTGWVRVVLALALAVSLLGSGGIASIAGYGEFWARLGFGALAVAAFLAFGAWMNRWTGRETTHAKNSTAAQTGTWTPRAGSRPTIRRSSTKASAADGSA